MVNDLESDLDFEKWKDSNEDSLLIEFTTTKIDFDKFCHDKYRTEVLNK